MADEEEEGALPGLDLSDSDDDATWTPFKNREDRERPVGVPNVVNQGENVQTIDIVLKLQRKINAFYYIIHNVEFSF